MAFDSEKSVENLLEGLLPSSRSALPAVCLRLS